MHSNWSRAFAASFMLLLMAALLAPVVRATTPPALPPLPSLTAEETSAIQPSSAGQAPASSRRNQAAAQAMMQLQRRLHPDTGQTPTADEPAEPVLEEEMTIDQSVAPLEEPVPQTQAMAELTPEQIELRNKVRGVLGQYYHKRLDVRRHTPWEMMHGIIAYGCDTMTSGAGPEDVNSIGYVCFNGLCKGERLLTITRGRIDARRGPRVQGHHGQLLAILAQSKLPATYPMRAEGRDFTVADLIETEKLTCRSGEELTFKLISLAHYLDTDQTWNCDRGTQWSIPRLLAEEMQAPIRGAACGGTHRLMGIAYAPYKRQKEGKPLDGEYARAVKYTEDYHRYTYSLQNPDGSFSTEWFVRKGNRPDVDRKIQTTGHILEWMAFSVPQDQLNDPRLLKAVDFLATTLEQGRNRQWEIGPLGHALHSLAIYDRRAFKPYDSAAPQIEEPAPLTTEAGQSHRRVAAQPQQISPQSTQQALPLETFESLIGPLDTLSLDPFTVEQLDVEQLEVAPLEVDAAPLDAEPSSESADDEFEEAAEPSTETVAPQAASPQPAITGPQLFSP